MGGQRRAPAALSPKKAPVPIVQEAGWVPGPVWTSKEKRKFLIPHLGLNPGPISPSESTSYHFII